MPAPVPAAAKPSVRVRTARLQPAAARPVDRARLVAAAAEAVAAERGGSGDGRRGPRTPVEEVVAGIWSAVLGVESVRAEENFFDLGGHSLLATQVISRVREAFRVE